MKVKVVNLLTSPLAVVDDKASPFFSRRRVLSQFFADEEEFAEELFLFCRGVVEFGEVFFGDDEEMGGGFGVNIFEGDKSLVFVNDL